MSSSLPPSRPVASTALTRISAYAAFMLSFAFATAFVLGLIG